MELKITEEEYDNALSTLSDSDVQFHIKREPNACFINSFFFFFFFLRFTANINIKTVVNHYKAVT